MKEIRKNLNLSKKNVSEDSFVSDKTIKRYESGEVVPSFDILEILSPFYKADLVDLLTQCRIDDYPTFYKIKKKIEMKLDGKKENDLNKELNDLNNLLQYTKSQYFKNLINQYITFIKAIELYNDKQYNLANDKFIEALKITIPSFNYKKYSSFTYSSMEIRILMNLAFIVNRQRNKKKYIEILEFCMESLKPDDEFYHSLCINLAGAYIRNSYYQEALEYSNIGIQSCIEDQTSDCLSNLYYTKGYAEYRLNKAEYIESFNNAIFICKILKQDFLKNIIIEKCKKNLGVELSDI